MLTIEVNYFRLGDGVIPLNQLLQNLPPAVQAEITRYQQSEDRMRTLVGKLLLNQKCHSAGMNYDITKVVARDRYNRPYITEAFDFNISHAGDYVLLACTKGLRVGVDIEKILPIKPEALDHWYNMEDLKQLASTLNPKRFFYEVWTKKEAVAKALGLGLGVSFSKIHLNDTIAIYDDRQWYLSPVQLDPDYIAHVACEQNHTLEITNVDQHTLMESLSLKL